LQSCRTAWKARTGRPLRWRPAGPSGRRSPGGETRRPSPSPRSASGFGNSPQRTPQQFAPDPLTVGCDVPPDPPIQPQGIILTRGLRAAGLRPAPYAGVALSADGARTWRVGSRLSVDPGLSVDLEGTRGEPRQQAAAHPRAAREERNRSSNAGTAGTSRAGTPAAYPHYCRLLDQPFTEQGKNEICHEQQSAACSGPTTTGTSSRSAMPGAPGRSRNAGSPPTPRIRRRRSARSRPRRTTAAG